ncbi:MAG: hypothetical protein PHH37_07355 [Paludibacter sp.]|nr:hypothetical protein [Paludibacter sp.]
MNKIEKIIYNIVKSTPWLKQTIRNSYQSFFDLLPRQKEFFKNPIEFKENYFFGFHDKSPFSNDMKKVLANHTSIPLRIPAKDEKLDVGYFHWKHEKFGEFVKIGESFSWNYHKGCRLQWIDSERLIYNTSIKNELCSVIVNINTLKEITINYPIDTVSKNGNYATSFSYERLQKFMPGYGYAGYNDAYSFLNETAPEETGIYLIDLRNNNRQLLVTLNDLANDLNDLSIKEKFKHYVTHTEFSTDGKYISFLHRWIGDDTQKRTSRLVIYDMENTTFKALPTGGMVSHYIWNEKNQVIAYCNIDGVDCHALFDIIKGNYKKICTNKLNSDGHQSIISDSKFVTDTYPDKFRMAKLYEVDIKTDMPQLIASVYSPKKFQTKDFQQHIACDLHPRVSPDKKFVCYDSSRTGKRGLYIMPLQ